MTVPTMMPAPAQVAATLRTPSRPTIAVGRRHIAVKEPALLRKHVRS